MRAERDLDRDPDRVPERPGRTTTLERFDPIERIAEHYRSMGWPAGDHVLLNLAIVRVHDILRVESTKVLGPMKVNRGRHELLLLLYFSRWGEMPMGNISKRLMIHATSVTSKVDGLERIGMVERVRHPTDRRTVLARITPRGRAAVERSMPEVLERLTVTDALTDEQARQAYELLTIIREAAGDMASKDTPPDR